MVHYTKSWYMKQNTDLIATYSFNWNIFQDNEYLTKYKEIFYHVLLKVLKQ
jgi:hypothetical protein